MLTRILRTLVLSCLPFVAFACVAQVDIHDARPAGGKAELVNVGASVRPETVAPPTSSRLARVLRDPSLATYEAPDSFRVRFKTTQGLVEIDVERKWSPLGADRFYNLVKIGFFADIAFFRVLSGFMAQFGIHGDPEISEQWKVATIRDDPVLRSNTRGWLSFATSGPGSRTTQIFINFANNARLDKMGFSPFGKVVRGMDVVDKIYAGYGEGAPGGNGPRQGRVQSDGNKYLRKEFAELDYIKSASFVK